MSVSAEAEAEAEGEPEVLAENGLKGAARVVAGDFGVEAVEGVLAGLSSRCHCCRKASNGLAMATRSEMSKLRHRYRAREKENERERETERKRRKREKDQNNTEPASKTWLESDADRGSVKRWDM